MPVWTHGSRNSSPPCRLLNRYSSGFQLWQRPLPIPFRPPRLNTISSDANSLKHTGTRKQSSNGPQRFVLLLLHEGAAAIRDVAGAAWDLIELGNCPSEKCDYQSRLPAAVGTPGNQMADEDARSGAQLLDAAGKTLPTENSSFLTR
jgi:hypothetical protein